MHLYCQISTREFSLEVYGGVSSDQWNGIKVIKLQEKNEVKPLTYNGKEIQVTEGEDITNLIIIN